jgi:hypothetical protein
MRVSAAQRASVSEAAWAVALRLRTFGYAEIAVEMKIGLDWATNIIRAWVKEGAAFEVETDGARKMFRADADFVRLAGRTAEDNMWTAFRKHRCLTPTEVAAHATTELVSVTTEQAATYCRALLDAGYLVAHRRAAPAMRREAIYRLANETGVSGPVLVRLRAIRDPNNGQITVLGGPV